MRAPPALVFLLPALTAAQIFNPDRDADRPPAPLAGRLANTTATCPAAAEQCPGAAGTPFCCPAGAFCARKADGLGGMGMACCSSEIGIPCPAKLSLDTCALASFHACAPGRSTTCCAAAAQCRFVSGGGGGGNSTETGDNAPAMGAEDMGGDLGAVPPREAEVWDCGALGGDQDFDAKEPLAPGGGERPRSNATDDGEGDGEGQSAAAPRVAVADVLVAFAGLAIAGWLL